MSQRYFKLLIGMVVSLWLVNGSINLFAADHPNLNSLYADEIGLNCVEDYSETLEMLLNGLEGQTVKKLGKKALRKLASHECKPINLMSTLLLFRDDEKRGWALMLDRFALMEPPGEPWRVLGAEELNGISWTMQNRFFGHHKGSMGRMAMSFLYFQNRNEWVDQGNDTILFAPKLFRHILFQVVLGLTEESIWKLEERLDQAKDK